MNSFSQSGEIQRFPGKGGWYYLALDEALSADFREMVKANWPSLLGAEFTLGETTWRSSIMPIKDGPLFIALPAKVRKAESLEEGQKITVTFTLT